MLRRCRIRLITSADGLLGVSTHHLRSGGRLPQQDKMRQKVASQSLQHAFPTIAAQWIRPVVSNALVHPSNLMCLSTKRQWWRCQECQQEYEQSVLNQVDRLGRCPNCNALPRSGVQATNNLALQGGDAQKKAKKLPYQKAYDVSPSLRHRTIDPMLAREWKDAVAVNDYEGEQLYASAKLDGIRCLVAYAPEVDRVLYISRRGSLFECCDSLDKHFRALFQRDPELMLDGELYTPLVTFEELNSLVRTTKKGQSEAVRESQRKLQYHAFDIMYSKQLLRRNKLASYPTRLALLKSLIPTPTSVSAASHDPDSKRFVPLFHVPSFPMKQRSADKFLDVAVSKGFEGIMIRRANLPYAFGKRTDALMKYKKFDTAEFEILDVVEGIGRCQGQAGALVCATKRQMLFHATPKSDGALRTALWTRRKEIIGKVVTVQFQGLSPENIPRFPVALSVRGSKDGSDWF